MSKNDSPKVREQVRKVKGKEYRYWIIDCGVVDGKRKWIRHDDSGQRFKNKAAAERQAERLRVRRSKIGVDAVRLTPGQIQDAAKALSVLGGQGSLQAAAEYFINTRPPEGSRRTIEEAVKEYIREAEARYEDEEIKERSFKNIKERTPRLAADLGDRFVDEVKRADADNWLRGLVKVDGGKYSPRSRSHFRVMGASLWNFCIEAGYAKENPFAPSRRRRAAVKRVTEIGILTTSQVRRLLEAAEKHNPEMLPAIAIGCFAGLRTAEIRRLDWSKVRFGAKVIRVDEDVAKSAYATRNVTITETLVDWLMPYRQESGPVCPVWRGPFDEVRGVAGFKVNGDKNGEPYPANGMRHSFASYHLAKHHNKNETAYQMGHNDTRMIDKHYKGLVDNPADGEAYWCIRRGDEGKRITITQAS